MSRALQRKVGDDQEARVGLSAGSTLLQTEVGGAVSEGGGPATLTQATSLSTATAAGAVRSAHDVRLVRARVDAVHEAGDLVRGPDAPSPTATQVTPTSSGIVRWRLRAGVDAPDEATERVRRPDVAGANSERGEALSRDLDPLRIVFVRGSIFATRWRPRTRSPRRRRLRRRCQSP